MDELLQGALAANKERDLVRLEQCLRESLELVLGWRTNEYLKAGKLDVALDHANALIEMYPNSPVGYISAGDVYSERCDYKRAIDIYAEGLAKSNERCTAEIVQRLESTKLLRDRKCDPLEYLPGELIAKIFDYVPEKRALCTRLSRSWRHRLPLLPMWSALHVGIIEQRTPGDWQNGLAQVLKPSLREIHIETDSSLCPILSLMRQAGCTNVRNAVISDTTEYNPDRSLPEGQLFLDHAFITDLRAVGGRLTHLQITSAMRPGNILTILLTLCPKLQRLSYDVEEFSYPFAPWDFVPPSAQPTDLRVLRWPDWSHVMSTPDLISNYCPKLQSLVVGCFGTRYREDISTYLERIQENCPHLQVLNLPPAMKYCNLDEPVANHEGGLRRLSLGPHCFVNPKVLSNIFHRHQETLEHFQSHMGTSNSESTDTARHILPLTLPRLKSLDLCYDVPRAIQPLTLFLHIAQAIEDVTLMEMALSAPMAEALASLPKLRSVTFKSCYCDPGVLQWLVEGQIAKGRLSTLEHLDISDDFQESWDDTVFACFGNLCNLRYLKVSARSRRYVKATAVRRFLSHAKRSGAAHKLRFLELPVTNSFRSARSLIMNTLTSIEHLHLSPP